MKITLNYDSACDFCEGMASVCRDGKWGFIDTSGREAVPCKYDGVDSFSEGMARVNIGGGWISGDFGPVLAGGKTGFIDKTGREVIPCQYDFANNFHDGLAQIEVLEEGKSDRFVIDKSGQRTNGVIPGIYDDAGDFYEGLARVERNKKWGFIDKTGREVVPCKYSYVMDFHEGMAQVWIGGEWSYNEEDAIHLPTLSGCKIGYIDKSGREVIPCQYDIADDFHDGLANVNGAFIDKTGQVVIQSAKCAGNFSEGLAVFYGNKSGYIDKTGQIAIPARFDRAYDFHDGLAMVKENRTWGFIDKSGRMVIEYKTEPAPEPSKFSVPDDELPF